MRLRKKRKKRYGSQNRRGMILNQVSIEKAAMMDQRSRIGDWEIDTSIGAHHQAILLSLVEHKS